MKHVQDHSGGTINVLGIDPGPGSLGAAMIAFSTSHTGHSHSTRLRAIETLKAPGHRPWECLRAARALERLGGVYPTVVVIEKPSDRIYGPKANPQVMKTYWQVIHLMEACHVGLFGGPILADTVDAFFWQSYPKGKSRRVMNDAQKRPLFEQAFPGWDRPTNSHTRDAALVAFWWLHVLAWGVCPPWNAGLPRASAEY